MNKRRTAMLASKVTSFFIWCWTESPARSGSVCASERRMEVEANAVREHLHEGTPPSRTPPPPPGTVAKPSAQPCAALLEPTDELPSSQC